MKELLNDDPAVAGDVAEYLGPDESARYNAVFRGGLKIYTTYDPVLQLMAASAVSKTLPPTAFAAALVVDRQQRRCRPRDVRGQDFSETQFDPHRRSGRQAGSSFKGITLATALDAGYSPNDRVERRQAERQAAR